MQRLTHVRELLRAKGSFLWTIGPDASLVSCARKMVDNDVGSLIVVDREQLVGIITWHDLLRHLAKVASLNPAVTVAEAMTTEVKTTTEDAALEDVEQLMARYHLRHLPVVRNELVVGMVTALDVLKLHALRGDALNQSLEHYIMGR